MNAPAIAANVITGVIAGVSAGVILAIIVEARRYVDFKMKRRGQIRYIRRIVEKSQELILSAQAIPPTDSARNDSPAELPRMEFPLDMVRGAYFVEMYREIAKTLEGRADTLTFDEKREVRGAFRAYDLILPGSDPFRPPSVPNGAEYHNIFDAFEAIKWLKVKSTDRTSLGSRPPEDGA
ncbi:hypothetical protein GBAR_LOCUS22267 [Geodia barretti]|uniref:Uncharacterized protein n=1 Tax=Geodia barretti TaxID=519541 RepID=A0AA35T2A8_GEOBA|nr:hypothetical protein GBAR_LOCUS22267 [Geodia barretti]